MAKSTKLQSKRTRRKLLSLKVALPPLASRPHGDMIEFFETQPDSDVQEAEYKRLLGYPQSHVLQGRARELADWARQWYTDNGRPWIYGRQVDDADVSHGQVRLDGIPFAAAALQKRLTDARADTAVVAIVSAGEACESMARRLWQEEKPDEYFFLEVYGSAVVEHLITAAGACFCAWADQNGLAVLPHASPGYADWEVSDQRRLNELIYRGASRRLPGAVEVLETGMLRPKKSQQAVFGVTSHLTRVERHAHLVPCASCALRSCQYRRGPYRDPPHQIEDVSKLRSQRPGQSDHVPAQAMRPKTNYLVSPKALRKWSQERLSLRHLEDDSVEARFRYEGTTCKSLGHRIEYDYYVKLDSTRHSYRVTDLRCNPAPDDTGHRRMCEYLENPESLKQSIDTEKPLLGRPIDEVFAWERNTHPAGCFCEPESRAHKWRLVFEVIHFALTQTPAARSSRPAL